MDSLVHTRLQESYHQLINTLNDEVNRQTTAKEILEHLQQFCKQLWYPCFFLEKKLKNPSPTVCHMGLASLGNW
jgi:hypothetical protein